MVRLTPRRGSVLLSCRRHAHASAGILADQNAAKREEIVALLTRAYWMEMETVMSYSRQLRRIWTESAQRRSPRRSPPT